VLNGHALNLDEMFDAVFSNAALHWMKEPARVIEGVANALKPCGRFVAEMGGAGNVSKVISGIADVLAARGITNGPKHPWYFPDEKEYGGLLADAGFIVHEIELIPRPTRLPGDVGGWIDTFGEGFFAEVPGADLPVIREEIIERLRPEICDDDGVWWADYVRLRFKAELSAEFLK
jgi:SAM-dependent methyltransferase